MSIAPLVTIFVRHSAECKYAGDEFEKRCRCRKHFRWTQNGKQYRRKTGTRAWAEAEQLKRELEDQLAGRLPAPETGKPAGKTIADAVELFLKDKKVQGVCANVTYKYTRELERLQRHCDANRVLVVQGITRELLTNYCSTWEALYPSTITRAKMRERLRSFLRYCYEAQWLPRIPQVPKIKIEEPETQPLTAEEYARLLDAIYVTVEASDAQQAKIHAFIQCMRWSGLAMLDALKLKRENLQHDTGKGMYRIVTNRTKTGTHVSVPIPQDVAQELLAMLNGNPEYIFWTGNGFPESYAKNWAKRYIKRLFDAAKINGDGYMKSHRLRDTFAVDLLEKGVPLEEVSKLLGHESIRTTEKSYAKWSKGRQDRLDALVTGTWETPKKKGKR